MINLTVMNNIMVYYGNLSKFGADIPLSVAGIVSKVFGIIIAIVVGLAAGSQPIIGFNYGAKKYDRVKELYEQSKSNAENQELELIDNKVKFTTYKDLQEFYKEQNIKFKPFAKSLKKTNKDYNMVKINKLNMLTALSVFAYIAVISLIFGVAYSFVSGVRFNKPISFLVMPIGASIYFCYYLVCYLKTPQKRIALDIAKYKLNKKLILISLLFIPLILAGNLIAGFTFVNIRLYQISIFYPLCFVLTYFVYYFARKFILKSKNLY